MSVSNENNSLWHIMEILNVTSRPDRLKALVILELGNLGVSDLADRIYGNSSENRHSQISAALAPMRRLKLVRSIRHGRFVSYEITDMGRMIIAFIDKIQESLLNTEEDQL